MLKNIFLLTQLCCFAIFTFLAPVHAQNCCGQNDCCDPCDTCCERFWVEADYLFWKIKDSPESVPLVVEGPITGPFEVVLGGHKIKNDWRSGGKITLGYWLDDCQTLGIEANYFSLPSKTKKTSVSSDGAVTSPGLFFPFFDVTTGVEDLAGIAYPGRFQGTATLKDNNHMQGAELNALMTIPCNCSMSYSLLAGFRYWNFNEHLRFDTNSPFIPPRPTDIYMTQDKFYTKNNFYGGQIGAIFDYNCDCFFLNVKGKVALGALCEEVTINGHLVTNDYNGFGAAQTFIGGYLALPTNIGHHKQTRFSVLPQVDVNFGYAVTECFRINVGYSFLYVSNVLWAGKQIDPNINPSQAVTYAGVPAVLVGEASPKAKMKTESLWTQGLNVGFEYKF